MPVPGQKEPFALPWDFSEWIPKPDLRAWVEAEIAGLGWENPEMADYLRRYPEFQPDRLLALLTLAYLTGVFDSEDIVGLAGQDPEFRAAGGPLAPSARELRQFRRDNRGLIKWILAQVMKRIIKQHFALGSMLVPAGLERLLVQSAGARLDLARHMDRAAGGA